MAIPRYHEFFPKVMESVQNGKEHNISEIKAYCVTNLSFTKEELALKYPKTGEFVILNRIGWALADLKAAGLLKTPTRGMYKITDIGREILNKHPENLTRKYLHQYGTYEQFAENYLKNRVNLNSERIANIEQNNNEKIYKIYEPDISAKIKIVPVYHKFFPKVMESVQDGGLHSVSEIKNYCISFSNFSREQLELKYPKSGDNVILDRISWAISELKHAGLLKTPTRGMYKITDIGRKILNECPENLTYKYLTQYGEFKNFAENYLKNKDSVNKSITKNKSLGQIKFLHKALENDPIEKIETAFNDINESLCKELLEEIMNISPYNFEDLVIKLLVKMGYGSEKFNEKAVTQRSFDEGIDGIVNADKFGFESIYTQAKRWDPKSTIGRPEIQKFTGALVGRGASKGLFITTAQFTREATEYAKRQHDPKIVLIDGKYLTELMIEYDIGTNTSKTFKLKRIDSEFFKNEVSLVY